MIEKKSISKQLNKFFWIVRGINNFNSIVQLILWVIVSCVISPLLLLMIIPTIVGIIITIRMMKKLNIDTRDIKPDLETFKKNYFRRKHLKDSKKKNE